MECKENRLEMIKLRVRGLSRYTITSCTNQDNEIILLLIKRVSYVTFSLGEVQKVKI